MGLAVVAFTNNTLALWYNQLCIMDSLKPIIRCPDVSRSVYMIKHICTISECQILSSSGGVSPKIHGCTDQRSM